MIRNLVLVLGDQLDAKSSALAGFDRRSDAVWMAEVAGEASYVRSHRARIALFLAAMRHFRNALRRRGLAVHYRELQDAENRGTLEAELESAIVRLRPARVVVSEPGEYRVKEALLRAASRHGVPVDIRPDRHFLCTPDEFAAHVAERRQLRLEYFYRQMRRRHRVLLDGDAPIGGNWNYDRANREPFGRAGPPELPPVRTFPPDSITRDVLTLVGRRFASHPGSLANFDWPVTAAQARAALRDFVDHRLARFGPYQDAMWSGRPYLYHSRLSAAMNLKLLDPREVVAAAETAFRDGRVPLASAEGFIRQVLGWREYVRGVYWHFMPGYADRNALRADLPLPALYWTAETDMNCLRETIGGTLATGYAHHIQRLMVTGLFALLLGVDPREVHRWYLAIYVDAVEWVELPNTLGMSQYADGGILASKPYAAAGRYIQRMSNYCAGCRYDPAVSSGDRACPFTVFYWDFLMRHENRLGRNARMGMQFRNLARLDRSARARIRRQAEGVRRSLFA